MFKNRDKVRCTANKDELWSMALTPDNIGDGTGEIIELFKTEKGPWWLVLWSNKETWYCREIYIRHTSMGQEQLLLFELT